jgi:hypothetical protein
MIIYTEMLYGKTKGFDISVLIMIIEKDINELYLLNFISSLSRGNGTHRRKKGCVN